MNDLIDNVLIWLSESLDPLLRKRGIIQDSDDIINAATEWLDNAESAMGDMPEHPDRENIEDAMNSIFPGGFAGFLKWRSACLLIEKKAEEKRKRDMAAIAGDLAHGTPEV